ncbi:hypothetical protein HOG21_06520 [bacterium]|nr:hypothetical protein [bacterium]
MANISNTNFSFIQYKLKISFNHQVEFFTISIKISSTQVVLNQACFTTFSALIKAFLYQSEKLL